MPRYRLAPEIAWGEAIRQWESGDPSHVARLLRDGSPPTADAREWLATLAEGGAKKLRGNPRLRSPGREPRLSEAARPFLVAQRYQLLVTLYAALARGAAPLTGGTPSEHAAEQTAREFGIGARHVHRLVKQVRGG